MSSLVQKREDTLEYAGVVFFGAYFLSLAALVVSYVHPL